MGPRRLFSRIYFYILGILLVVALTTFAVLSSLSRPAVLHGPAERLVRRVSARVEARLDDPPRRAALIRELADDFDLDVTLRDGEGRVLEAVGPELPVLSPRDQEALGRGPLIVSPRHARGWFAAAPLRDGRGQLTGVLEVSLMRRHPSPSLLKPALTIALVLLLVAICTLPLSRRITRPIDQLTEANRRLGAGDLAYRIPLRWKDELSAPWGRRRRRWRRGAQQAARDPRCEGWHGQVHAHLHEDELHQLMRSWNEMAGRIEALVRSQKELLANVSHELRSPLSRIRVALALLPEDPPLQARLRDVEADLSELERLIDDVLTTSRLEASGLPLRLQAVAARPLLAALAERGGPKVQLAPGADVELWADGALLKRALWNLVENALKYGAPPVTLSLEVVAGSALLRVCDEGAGVPAAERERVLEPFYRGDKARTPSAAGPGAGVPQGGFGLGLTLARRIAEVHGGGLTLTPLRREGDREVGLCVTLRVPLRTGPEGTS